MSDTDSRWMTYRELAEELGISLRAAEARARRQVRAGRWHQRNHNDALKTAMVKVPRADLETMRKGTAGDTAPTTPGGAASVAQGGTVPDTYPQAIKAALDVLEAAHLRELDGVKASHERVLAARDELAGELRQRAEKAEMGQEAERAARQAAEAQATQLAAALAVAEAEPGVAKALRQGRAILAGWIGGRKA
jgi:hypothetical protein